MPSAAQKRPWAKGRSADTHRTWVFSRPAARLLNSRTLFAQTPVSREGKMLSTTRLPRKSSRLISPSSESTRVNPGAWLPTAGSSPTVLIGFPSSVICAIKGSFLTATFVGLPLSGYPEHPPPLPMPHEFVQITGGGTREAPESFIYRTFQNSHR